MSKRVTKYLESIVPDPERVTKSELKRIRNEFESNDWFLCSEAPSVRTEHIPRFDIDHKYHSITVGDYNPIVFSNGEIIGLKHSNRNKTIIEVVSFRKPHWTVLSSEKEIESIKRVVKLTPIKTSFEAYLQMYFSHGYEVVKN